MRIVTPPLEIDEGEPFGRDVLNRKGFGLSLMNLVTRSKDELVICLDGRWGEGKTTFIKMWQGTLKKENVPCIYIDAFSNDHVDDAFIAVASAINRYVENHTARRNEAKEFHDKAKKVGAQLLSWSAKVAIKAATLGVIKDSDFEALKDVQNDVAESLSSVTSDFVSERLISHGKDIEVMDSFRALLSEIPKGLTEEGDKPLVIIIDELDRCRPTYAVELVEKVKHLFAVKNVVFVLVMHRKQLEEAVKCVYGKNMDAHTYLQKFINIEASLPKRMEDRYSNDIAQYTKRLYDLHELETWGDKEHLLAGVEVLAKHFNLSLRQLERVYTNLAVFYGSSAKNEIRITPLIAFLSVIKVVDPTIFDALLKGALSYEELCTSTGLSESEEVDGDARKLQFIAAWLRYALIPEEQFRALRDDDRAKDLGSSLWNYNVEREQLLQIFIRRISLFEVA